MVGTLSTSHHLLHPFASVALLHDMGITSSAYREYFQLLGLILSDKMIGHEKNLKSKAILLSSHGLSSNHVYSSSASSITHKMLVVSQNFYGQYQVRLEWPRIHWSKLLVLKRVKGSKLVTPRHILYSLRSNFLDIFWPGTRIKKEKKEVKK